MIALSDFLENLSDVARSMEHEQGTQPTLDSAVSAATSIIEGCDYACICIVHKDAVRTVAASDEAVFAVQQLQHDLHEGPDVDALREQETGVQPGIVLGTLV